MNFIFNSILPPAKTAVAHQTDTLFWFVHLSGLFITAVLIGIVAYFVFKYKRKSEDEVTPVIKNSVKLEVTWTLIPLALVFIVFAWGYKIYMIEETPPDDAYEIKVTGQQWLWRFDYKNGATSTKELHVPAGRPVNLIMNSKDVIHSFYVPDFRIKKDVVPGRRTQLWFNAPDTGSSVIFCAEYCGASHSDMLGTVVVQSEEDFQNWLANNKGSAAKPEGMEPAEWGKQLTQANACQACHSTDGNKMTGPRWKGVYGSKVSLSDGSTVTADEDYIKESILKPNEKVVQGFDPVMTSYEGQLNDEQIDAIIEYLKTLK